MRVVAFEQAVALPFASCIMAELGADVIKIERPGSGDVVRGWDDYVEGLSSGFVAFNMGKRDITIDASKPQGRMIIRELAATADVFIENFTPGTVAKLGIGPEDLRGVNPRLVYCSLSGYGQDGPFKDVKAYDLLVQGESGILLTNGYPDAPAKVGMPVTDLIAGSHAVMAVMGALIERGYDGLGSFIDLALLDSAAFWLGYFPHQWWHRHEEPARGGMRHQFICPYGPFLAQDGRFVNVAVASEPHWKLFCEVVEQPLWRDDPRFDSMTSRRDNMQELNLLVADAISSKPSDHWSSRLAQAGLPFGSVRSMSEVVEHPQLKHRRMFVKGSSPVGEIPMVRFPLSSPDKLRAVPGLGQHTDEVLGELGYGDDAIEVLRLDGIV
ncbi:MAG: CaiB/BaiF CoA transferase family protein [Actinomycetota bacterium]|nr:CoA transferase [Actinomycetota bacterium]